MNQRPPYVTVPCDTCGVAPGERCQTAEGEPFDFGGTHVTRVKAGLRASDSMTPREEQL